MKESERIELETLYKNRFNEKQETQKREIWIEICDYFLRNNWKSRLDGGTLVDIGAGYCDFINNIGFSMNKVAFDANPACEEYAAQDVTVILDDINNFNKHFTKDSVSLVFASNFLEHITKDDIKRLFCDVYDALLDGGEFWILTPNIKYTGGKYWDFFDHISPITDDSLIEVGQLTGFSCTKNLKKFLPFTTKSHLPQWRWIVRLYLRLMPVSGWLFGEQSFLIFQK